MSNTITDTQIDTQTATDDTIIALVDGYKVTSLATLDDFPSKIEPIERTDTIYRYEHEGGIGSTICTPLDSQTKDEREGAEREEVTSEIRVHYSITWEPAQPEHPNAIAFVSSYPGDYTEIGRYENGEWTPYGVIDGIELLLPHWERRAYMITWSEAYASFPRMYILNPSHTETPGGEGEDFRHYLAIKCGSEAFVGAAEAFSDAYGEGRGAVFHRNDDQKMLGGYPIFSFEVDDPESEKEKIIIDVRMKFAVGDVAIRKPGDPLPEWATEEKYKRDRERAREEQLKRSIEQGMQIDPFGNEWPKLEDVLVGKSLAELTSLIDAGQTVYAHTGKQQDDFSVWHSPKSGTYHYKFEVLGLGLAQGWHSKEGESLTAFLDGINFNEENEYDREMKAVLTQSVWSTMSEASYNMLLENLNF